MRQVACALVIFLGISSSWAGARSVDFQSFGPPISAAQRPQGTGEAASNGGSQDRLVADFIAMGNSASTAPPINAGNLKRGCAAAPYKPSSVLSVSAERRRATWFAAMSEAACVWDVPPYLLDALIIQESRYNPAALSPKGATGIAQLMPSRARILGVRNVWNPAENLNGGARYLRSLLDEFGRFDLALAAYNAGEGRIRASHQIPRIRETVHYVANILTIMRKESP